MVCRNLNLKGSGVITLEVVLIGHEMLHIVLKLLQFIQPGQKAE